MIKVPDHIIAFKDEQTRSEFKKVKPRLQAFILAAGAYMYFTFGVTLIVTDLIRDDPKSTHGHKNGVDFRTSNLTDYQGDALVKFMKWQFPYYLKTTAKTRIRYSIRDERKPGTSKNWTAPHIHGQVNWRED